MFNNISIMAEIKTFDNKKVYYQTSENKTGIWAVFLHGLGCNASVWKEIVLAFQKKGFCTLTVDLRGHGYSSKDAEIKDDYIVKDLEAIFKKEKIRNVVLVCNSFSSGAATIFANKNKLRKLVYITPVHDNPIKYSKAKMIAEYVSKIPSFFLKIKTKKEKEYDYGDHSKDKNFGTLTIYFKHFRENPFRTHVQCYETIFNKDYSEELKKLKVACLIIASGKDEFVSKDMIKDMKSKINNCSLKTIRNADHTVIIKKPKKIAKLILQFINKK